MIREKPIWVAEQMMDLSYIDSITPLAFAEIMKNSTIQTALVNNILYKMYPSDLNDDKARQKLQFFLKKCDRVFYRKLITKEKTLQQMFLTLSRELQETALYGTTATMEPYTDKGKSDALAYFDCSATDGKKK